MNPAYLREKFTIIDESTLHWCSSFQLQHETRLSPFLLRQYENELKQLN